MPRLVSTEALATPISSESVLILHHALVQLTTSFHATKRSPKSNKQDNLPQFGNCAFLREESREKYQESRAAPRKYSALLGASLVLVALSAVKKRAPAPLLPLLPHLVKRTSDLEYATDEPDARGHLGL